MTLNSALVGFPFALLALLLIAETQWRTYAIFVTVTLALITAVLRLWAFPRASTPRKMDRCSLAFIAPAWIATLIFAWWFPAMAEGTNGMIVLSALTALIFFSRTLFAISLALGLLGFVAIRYCSSSSLSSFEWLQTLILFPWMSLIIRYAVDSNLKRIRQFNDENESISGRLDHNEKQLTAILERSPLVLCVMDSEGVYVQSRGTGLNALCLEQNEIVGLPYTQVFSPYPQIIEAVTKAKSGQRAQVRAKFGPNTFFDIIYEAVINEEQEITGIIGVGIDVSSRVEMELKEKELELHLFQTQKEESMSTLAGGIAHDFNNYLMSIVGFCESLAKDNPSAATPDTIHLIKKTALQAAGLSKQMLVYASKDPNVSTPRTSINLPDFFHQHLDLLSAAVPKNINFRAQEKTAQAIWVAADKILLQQIILNLLHNSIEAIGNERAGSIEINLNQHAQCPGNDFFTLGKFDNSKEYCEIEFTDTGCGIEKEFIPKVFDLYYSTKLTGHGIGLAVSASIVQNHGGIIACKSSTDVGTTIKLLLPTSSKPANEPPSQTKKHKMELSGKRVMIIDDEPTVLLSVAMMLESRGCSVDKAESGMVALEKLPAVVDDLDCIILDYTMPTLNGLQVLQKIREMDFKTPVIMCSGLPLSRKTDPSPVWPDDLLTKPFQLQELCDKIQQVCQTS